MKTILRIIIILLVAAIVSGGFFLAFNNNSTASLSNEGRQPPAFTNANGQSFQPMARPERGDHDGGGGVFGTLAKIAGITILVVALQKAFSLIGNRKPISVAR